MRPSVVIRTKDESRRLRLTLTSLSAQSVSAQVVVVNDGSSDDTHDVLREAANWVDLLTVEHTTARGRSAASNAGARAATGDLLVFLDGDTLAGPHLVERHVAAHATPGVVGRGETFHIRSTRLLRDPETLDPWPADEHTLFERPRAEVERMRITRDEILHDFASVERRASPGVYPGSGARRVYELEMDALHNHPDSPVLWAAACGSNLSVERTPFLQAGGFLEALDLNEHRELALRLYAQGVRLVPVPGARTYHLIHGVTRNPLEERAWEDVFYRAHPTAVVKLLPVLWASLAPDSTIPPAERILSLPELEAAAARARRC
ncbi:MAG TPA: glycosyltransferase family 2 protein [Candidatus Baltobacteraceae bacterium]|jgi:GT2 family glycosyltransferase